MKCKIMHESEGRLRIRAEKSRMTLREADILEYYMKAVPGVNDVKVYDRTCDAVILYEADRSIIIRALAVFSFKDEKAAELVPDHTSRALNREFEDKLFFCIARRIVNKLIVPMPLRKLMAIYRSVRYIRSGLRCLADRRIEVPVLDATAIAVSLIRGDFGTASSIMFLLNIGEIMEDWTRKKSVADLAGAMALNVDRVWKNTADGREVLVPVSQIEIGDEFIVRTGNMIPLDGKVVSGEMTVNQASMTGESLPVHKEHGGYVYAGTVVEEGECIVCADKGFGSGRYDRIVRMIEESEKLKSTAEDKASHLADKLVPYTLGATGLVYLLTRNVTKALAVLMVDFSCALKLSMPIAVLSAIREGSSHSISIKGGKFLESVSVADTIVFDKTGTITKATPVVNDIVSFSGEDEDELLRLAACLEEHYPHSIANAVVEAAASRGLTHEERHSRVEYIVAHGITGIVDNKKIVLGSEHFVFEDEKCVIPEGKQEMFDSLPDDMTHLYMSISGSLAAVICIDDPIKEEAPSVVARLHEAGFGKVVMMTGDNERTARSIAAAVGIDEYHAEVLPEDKAAFIRSEHEAGRKVIMVGDGVNDTPALSEADVGIAVNSGAAIAREIADITISADDLETLVTLKHLSNALMARVNSSYRFIIGFNFMLIVLGVGGILPPATSALMHNVSTICIGLHNMTDLLE